MASTTETLLVTDSNRNGSLVSTSDSKKIKTADHAIINYFSDSGHIDYDPKSKSIYIEAEKHTNPVKVPLTDVRDNFQRFNLDTHGF